MSNKIVLAKQMINIDKALLFEVSSIFFLSKILIMFFFLTNLLNRTIFILKILLTLTVIDLIIYTTEE